VSKVELMKCDRCGHEDKPKTFLALDVTNARPPPAAGLFGYNLTAPTNSHDLCANCAEDFRAFLLGAEPPQRERIRKPSRVPAFVLEHQPPLDQS
jgi:hypothetical protein